MAKNIEPKVQNEVDLYNKSNTVIMGGSNFSNEEDLIYTAALVHRERRQKNEDGIYEIKFTISELKQILGYGPNNNYLRTIAPDLEKKMMTRFLGFEDYERGIFEYESFFTGVRYNEESDEFILKFNPALDKFNFNLLESGRYTTYSLQLRLKSKINTWNVYEFLKAKYDYVNAVNKKKGQQGDAIVKIVMNYHELRFKIGVDDINDPAARKIIVGKKNPDFKAAAEAIDNAYIEKWKRDNRKIYTEAIEKGEPIQIPNCRPNVDPRKFTTNVLKPAKEWINKNTELYVTYTTLRDSKKCLYAVEFQIGPRELWNVGSEETQEKTIEYVIDVFEENNIAIKKKDARTICEIFRWDMVEFEKYFKLMKTQKIKTSYVGWLKVAYENKYIDDKHPSGEQMDFFDAIDSQKKQHDFVMMILDFGLDNDIHIIEKDANRILEHVPNPTKEKLEKLFEELATEVISQETPIDDIIHICDDIFGVVKVEEIEEPIVARTLDEKNNDIRTTKQIFRSRGFDPASDGTRINIDSYRSLLEAAGYESSDFVLTNDTNTGALDKFLEYIDNYSKDIDNIVGFGISYFRSGEYKPVKKKASAKPGSFNNFEQRDDVNYDELERAILGDKFI